MGVLPGITILRIIIALFIWPLMCGSFFAVRTRIHERRGFFLNAYIYGWIAVFALFEMICVPYVIRLGSFDRFCRVYQVCIVVLAPASVLAAVLSELRRKRAAAAGEGSAPEAEKTERTAWWAKALWAVIILSVLAQMVYFYFYNHMNGDDSYYVAESVITDFFDTMYQRDAYTGMPLGLDVRHALAVLPMFITWLARICGLHAATMAHAILGPVFLGMMYCVYTMVGRVLFAKDRSYIPVFVLIVEVWYLWGNVSIYTPETFLYTRTWQGKAVFANIIIPLAFVLLCRLLREWRAVYAALLAMLLVAGVFTTTAAVYLLTALYGIAALYCLITERRFGKCLRMLLCAVPGLAYGAVYLYLLKVW